jgi:hypothetical protein
VCAAFRLRRVLHCIVGLRRAREAEFASNGTEEKCRWRYFDIRFGYGANPPFIEKVGDGIRFMSGPDALMLRTPMALGQSARGVSSDIRVKKDDRIPLQLTWFASHDDPPTAADSAERTMVRTSTLPGKGIAELSASPSTISPADTDRWKIRYQRFSGCGSLRGPLFSGRQDTLIHLFRV